MSTQPEVKNVVVEKSDEMPTIQIDMADRSCVQDSDCEHIGTQCSCGCGQGVNKSYADKYKTKLEELCKSYNGKMCKVLCEGKVTCKEKICTYGN